MKIVQNQTDINNLTYEQKCLLMYQEPKQPGDINYIAIFYVLIRDNFGQLAADNFINTSYIYSVINKRPLPQRVMINKYFTNILLNWRSSPISTPIWGVLPFLSLDGDNANWVNGMANAIFPFLKYNCVL